MVGALMPGVQPDHAVVDVGPCPVTFLVFHPIEHPQTVFYGPCSRHFLHKHSAFNFVLKFDKLEDIKNARDLIPSPSD